MACAQVWRRAERHPQPIRAERRHDHDDTEWVALDTFANEAAGMFYEAGGVYPHKPISKAGARGPSARDLRDGLMRHCKRLAVTRRAAA